MPLFLGIDGGGTATRALLCDETGRTLGAGSGGVANHLHAGWAGATESVGAAVRAAFAAANLTPEPCAAVFLGMAAASSDEARNRWREIALKLGLAATPAAIGVDHDIRIALAGGLAGRPGIALIAGTGSACFGRTTDGTTWRAGGWGSILDDGGGGYWLGLRGISAAIRAADGRGPQTTLTDRILARLGVANLREIVTRLHGGTLTRPDIARVAEDVMQAAVDGDQPAREILARGAVELATMVSAVAEKLFQHGNAEVCLCGSVATAPEFRPQIEAATTQAAPTVRVVTTELSPVAGAALLALELGGREISGEIRSALAR